MVEVEIVGVAVILKTLFLIFIFAGSIFAIQMSVLFPESNIVIWWLGIVFLTICYLVARRNG